MRWCGQVSRKFLLDCVHWTKWAILYPLTTLVPGGHGTSICHTPHALSMGGTVIPIYLHHMYNVARRDQHRWLQIWIPPLLLRVRWILGSPLCLPPVAPQIRVGNFLQSRRHANTSTARMTTRSMWTCRLHANANTATMTTSSTWTRILERSKAEKLSPSDLPTVLDMHTSKTRGILIWLVLLVPSTILMRMVWTCSRIRSSTTADTNPSMRTTRRISFSVSTRSSLFTRLLFRDGVTLGRNFGGPVFEYILEKALPVFPCLHSLDVADAVKLYDGL
jgi:hypothetical protein